MKGLSVGVYSGLVHATDVFGSTAQSAIQYQGEKHKKTTALMCLSHSTLYMHSMLFTFCTGMHVAVVYRNLYII